MNFFQILHIEIENNSMIKVAITGGIGSGKSTVCRLFNQIGVPTFDSDSSAKEQYKKPSIKKIVVELLGEQILTDDEVDLKKISDICFKDNEVLNKLTDIISNGVLEDYSLFLINNDNSIYTIFESAIIINRNKTHLFDKIIGVVADKDIRIKRVMERSNLPKEEIIKRINNQVSDEEIMDKSNFIIINNSNLEKLLKEVEDINLKIYQSL